MPTFFGENVGNIKADGFSLVIDKMTKHITNATRVINENGGWNIYGWYKFGEKIDAAMDDVRNPDIYTVISSTARFHISYLYPANKDETFLQKLLYKF